MCRTPTHPVVDVLFSCPFLKKNKFIIFIILKEEYHYANSEQQRENNKIVVTNSNITYVINWTLLHI